METPESLAKEYGDQHSPNLGSNEITRSSESCLISQHLGEGVGLLLVSIVNRVESFSRYLFPISFCARYGANSILRYKGLKQATIELCEVNARAKRVDIGKYKRLTMFLKKKSKGHRSKKPHVFSKEHVNKFLNEAPDETYLGYKTVLIFGIAGALRRGEFINLTVDDVRNLDESLLFVKIDETKNNVPRPFTITGEFYNICIKYMQCRPKVNITKRFFLKYSNEKCVNQPIRTNKIPKIAQEIAAYLKLPSPEGFTGHAFRRTSATLLVDAGADLTTLQRHGGWKSGGAAFGYVADSLNNKKKICEQISDGIELNKHANHSISASNAVTNSKITIVSEETLSTRPCFSSSAQIQRKYVSKPQSTRNLPSVSLPAATSTSYPNEEIFLENVGNKNTLEQKLKTPQKSPSLHQDRMCNDTRFREIFYDPVLK